MSEQPLLSVRDLRTYFETDDGIARAVDGVTFEVQAGEMVGLVGESGSGKSVTSLSIIRLLARAGRIMEGSSVRFRGRELTDIDESAMRAVRGSDIAMIFQEPATSLNPVFPIGEQIAESVRTHKRTSRAAARAHAVDLLRTVGIEEPEARIDDYPHQLSGGQRQRVMIAIALACEPALLIADEATTALDVTIQAQILDLLRMLRDRLGMAILMITHDLGVVAETCDRVLVMYGGQIVEQASVRDLFMGPRHPYTSGLMRAIPRLGQSTERLAVIAGTVPSATAWPSGCRFHTRCEFAWDRCSHMEPPLLDSRGPRNDEVPPSGSHAAGTPPREGNEVGPHASRCWLEDEPGRRERAGSPADRASGSRAGPKDAGTTTAGGGPAGATARGGAS